MNRATVNMVAYAPLVYDVFDSFRYITDLVPGSYINDGSKLVYSTRKQGVRLLGTILTSSVMSGEVSATCLRVPSPETMQRCGVVPLRLALVFRGLEPIFCCVAITKDP